MSRDRDLEKEFRGLERLWLAVPEEARAAAMAEVEREHASLIDAIHSLPDMPAPEGWQARVMEAVDATVAAERAERRALECFVSVALEYEAARDAVDTHDCGYCSGAFECAKFVALRERYEQAERNWRAALISERSRRNMQ